MRIIIKNKQEDLKINCHEDHEEITGYNEEPDKRYCTDSGELQGVSCTKCIRLFTEKEGGNVVIPTIKYPIYICSGRQEYKCKHSLCHKCYMDRLNNGGVRKRRKKNS